MELNRHDVARVTSLRERARSLGRKLSTAAALSMVSMSAFAQETLPTDIDGIVTWGTPKVLAALAVGVFITVAVIAMRVNKLPRRA
jgi:uncharacterized membrane protein (DUF485 family)